MAKVSLSAIRKSLEKVTGLSRDKDEEEQAYLKRIATTVNKLENADWDKLSEEAQDWYNEAAKSIKANDSIAVLFEAEDEPTPKTRARAKVDEDEPKTKVKDETTSTDEPPDPKTGDYVIIVDTGDKRYAGEVAAIDEKYVYVVIDGEEEPVKRSKIKSIKVKAAEAEKNDKPAEPKIGDTVEVILKDGESHIGKLIDIDDRTIEIDVDGDEKTFKVSKVEKVKVKKAAKVKAADDDEAKPKAKEKAEPKPKAKSKEDDDSPSKKPATVRIREIICEKPSRTKEQVQKILDDEGVDVKGTTLDITYSEVSRTLTLLRQYGHLS